MSDLSEDFQGLYYDVEVYSGFSSLHAVSFARVLPLRAQDPVVDNPRLVAAETRHLANPNDGGTG